LDGTCASATLAAGYSRLRQRLGAVRRVRHTHTAYSMQHTPGMQRTPVIRCKPVIQRTTRTAYMSSDGVPAGSTAASIPRLAASCSGRGGVSTGAGSAEGGSPALW
jgi:hypothetical protein